MSPEALQPRRVELVARVAREAASVDTEWYTKVVRAIAINPNTVLRAYKELEHQGFVAARPGSAPWS